MNYTYKALVIDDEDQIHVVLTHIGLLLKRDYGLLVDFEIAKTQDEYDTDKAFDILLVDYNLKKGFRETLFGTQFIEKFRAYNQVSQVVFYSSEFQYNKNTNYFELPFNKQDIFDLVNELGVNGIASKDNKEQMALVVAKCCHQLNPISITLHRIFEEYKNAGISLSFTTKDGVDLPVEALRDELLKDTDIGQEFRHNIIRTMLTTLLKHKFD